MMERIKTIVEKEWAEVFKNRLVLFTVAFLPLVFVALPLITLAATEGIEGAGTGDDSLPIAEELCAGLSEAECAQIYMLDIYSLLFMILPVMIPVTIAAYSIVGEKTMRSLEPLLATPITTLELVVGKGLAAAIPAIAATWLGYAIYVLGVRQMASEAIFARLLNPLWLVAVFVLGPLLTIMAVSVAIMVSSRVNEPRVAEQLSAVVIMPLILFIIGQAAGILILNRQIVIAAAVVVALIDGGLVYMAVRTFERESILTRWK